MIHAMARIVARPDAPNDGLSATSEPWRNRPVLESFVVPAQQCRRSLNRR